MLKAKITMPDFTSLLPSREQVIALGVATVNVVLDRVEQDYAATYATWDGKPKFIKERARLAGTSVIGSCYTQDPNYVRMNDGTSAHMVGRNRQWMAFSSGYRQKTTPHHIGSGRGGPFGNKVVARGPWKVRGIVPREFQEVVSRKAQRQLDINTKKLAQLLR